MRCLSIQGRCWSRQGASIWSLPLALTSYFFENRTPLTLLLSSDPSSHNRGFASLEASTFRDLSYKLDHHRSHSRSFWKRRCSSNDNRNGHSNSKDRQMDSLIEKRTPENIESKFGQQLEESEIDFLQNQPNEETGHLTDRSPVDPELPAMSSQFPLRGDLCEEGFWMDYMVTVTTKKPSILDHIRQGNIHRGKRDWQHLDPATRRLKTIDYTLEEGEVGPSYRIKDQAVVEDQRRLSLPPWSRRSLPTLQLTEKPFYVEVEGGGKLGNKIHDVELSVEQLRVDTRRSIWRSRLQKAEEASRPLNAKLENLENMVRKDETLRGMAGSAYEPMMLLTIGAQGSGKSKFSFDLVEYGALPWARINQDTLRDGKRGMKEECALKAKYMMKLGYCVVIDRMNYSIDQRDVFVELSRSMRCPIHAVVFRLPFVENVYNVAKRIDHEGNFEGNTLLHRQIIYYTRSRIFNGGHPKESNEGFRSVFECRSNEDYAFAFRQWMNLGREYRPVDPSTIDNWLKTQPSWRHQHSPELQEIEDMINEEEPWKQTPRLPVIQPDPNPDDMSFWQRQTVGYLPSRDGPLDFSDDER